MDNQTTQAGVAIDSTQLLGAIADLLECFAAMEGTWYQDNWRQFGISADMERVMCAAWESKYNSVPNAAGQGAAKPYPAPACSPLPPCALCGRTEYPVEYGPRQNKLPAGSLVGFDNGERVWICRRCSRDPAALERLETGASLTANARSHFPSGSEVK